MDRFVAMRAFAKVVELGDFVLAQDLRNRKCQSGAPRHDFGAVARRHDPALATSVVAEAFLAFDRCLNQANHENGFTSTTPLGLKCRRLRVATIRPCSSAVAAISRSAPSCPKSADSRPQRLAIAAVIGRM